MAGVLVLAASTPEGLGRFWNSVRQLKAVRLVSRGAEANPDGCHMVMRISWHPREPAVKMKTMELGWRRYGQHTASPYVHLISPRCSA